MRWANPIIIASPGTVIALPRPPHKGQASGITSLTNRTVNPVGQKDMQLGTLMTKTRQCEHNQVLHNVVTGMVLQCRAGRYPGDFGVLTACN